LAKGNPIVEKKNEKKINKNIYRWYFE